jgi:signal transduction histidine kinase
MVLNPQRQIVAANQQLLDFVGASSAEEVLGLRPGEVLECRNALEAENGCGTGQPCALCGALGGIFSAQSGHANRQICRLRRGLSTGEEAANLEVTAAPLSVGGEPFTILFAENIRERLRGEFLDHAILPQVLARAAEIDALAAGLAGPIASELRERTTAALSATVGRLAATIESYRGFLLAEAGELPIALRGLSALGALRDAVAEFQFDEAAAGRLPQIVPGAEDLLVFTDPAQLRKILRSMLLNALEASAPPSIVTAGCRGAGNRVEVWVRNDGEMPLTTRHQVFQRGFSTKGPGRGLGTYLMKLIAERFLGGTVSFQSAKPEGTTFVLSLPLPAGPAVETAL